jgi:serine/threonine-protein phosphatase CPPED1
MRNFRISVAFFSLFLIALSCQSQKRNSDSPFFFIQVTDPQFGMIESNRGFEQETKLYQKAIDAINKLSPDFVVITGDIVNNREDRSQVAGFKRITAMINHDIPVWYSPGNHDIGQPPSQKDIDLFVKDYGHDRFVFMHKKCLFIGLNSCIIKSGNSEAEQKQFDWLSHELKKHSRARQTLILCHYPFFINKFDEPENYSNMPPETRERYFDLFEASGVDAIFAGHLHDNVVSRYKNIEVITTGASGKSLSDDPSGLRIIKVYPDHVESSFYGFEELPANIMTDK